VANYANYADLRENFRDRLGLSSVEVQRVITSVASFLLKVPPKIGAHDRYRFKNASAGI
jgi:hypothetical protein